MARSRRVSWRATTWAASLAIVYTLLGCASEGPAMFADRLYLDTSREPCGHEGTRVEILQKPPDRPYTRVAYLEAYAAFYAADEVGWGSLRRALCEQASEAGADAIIDMAFGGRSYSRDFSVLSIEYATAGDAKKLTGTAIRYDDESP